MNGVEILTRSLSVPVPRGRGALDWQYHSRSDLHSKVACWGILFDLLRHSHELRRQMADGSVVFGVNFEINDWEHGRKKNLDLVLARPQAADAPPSRVRTYRELAEHWSVQLSRDEQRTLDDLPNPVEGAFGANAVLLALEAKAAMTEHVKAGPRFYDELNSSHLIVHAASNDALAVGFAMINAAETFVSPDLNRGVPYRDATRVTRHRQPEAAAHSVRRVESLPRRAGSTGVGYDGLAIVVVDMPNDGTPVGVVESAPAPAAGSPYHYASMISRVAHEYENRFGGI